MCKEWTVYSKWLARGLRRQGFKQLRIEVNHKHPQYNVWVFENSTDLQIAMLCLTEQREEWRARK